MHGRRLTVAALAALLLALVAAPTASAYYKYGFHGFGADTVNEKYGFRGWLKTIAPKCPDPINQHTLSNLYIATEWGLGSYPWVEIGCFRGRMAYGGCKSTPCCYWGWCPSTNPEDYVELYAEAYTKEVGTWQKYGIRRDGTNPNGQYRWKFFIDGELIDTIAVDHPGYGHPTAGGELMSLYTPSDDDDRPHIDSHGKNIGTGDDGDYYNFMTSDGTWYKWSTSYGVYDVYHSSGITFETSAPYHSVFEAAGD